MEEHEGLPEKRKVGGFRRGIIGDMPFVCCPLFK
jgi:hypothetical protein